MSLNQSIYIYIHDLTLGQQWRKQTTFLDEVNLKDKSIMTDD